VTGAAGPFEELSRLRPESVTERVLALDSQLQSHLVDDAALDEQARAFVLELAGAPTWRGNVYQSVKRAEAAARERLELASLVRSYSELKRRLGYVEFSDQMASAARIATRVPQVAQQLRDSYQVVLLDEYQDTSAAQALLLKGLFSGSTPEEGQGHPVTAVGDPFQAIYGWRGAAASNILAFPTDFPLSDGRPATVLPLTINRRSGPRILDVANELAAPLRADETIAYDLGRTLLRAPDGTAPGQVETRAFSAWPEEVSWVVDRIVAAHESEVAAWNQTAVLARRNADIGAIYAALLDRDVPAEIVGLGGLLTLPEVADVVSTLRLIDDVAANPDLVRLLTGPRWAIGVGDLELLGRRAKELAHARAPWADGDGSLEADLEAAVSDTDPSESVSLAEALTDLADAPVSPEARERFAALGAELATLRRHATEPVGDLVRRVASTLGRRGRARGGARAGSDGSTGGVPGRGGGLHVRGLGRDSPWVARIPRRRARAWHRARSGTSEPRRLREAADHPPGEGPRVGHGRAAGSVQQDVPLGSGHRQLGTCGARALPPSCAATRGPSRSWPRRAMLGSRRTTRRCARRTGARRTGWRTWRSHERATCSSPRPTRGAQGTYGAGRPVRTSSRSAGMPPLRSRTRRTR